MISGYCSSRLTKLRKIDWNVELSRLCLITAERAGRDNEFALDNSLGRKTSGENKTSGGTSGDVNYIAIVVPDGSIARGEALFIRLTNRAKHLRSVLVWHTAIDCSASPWCRNECTVHLCDNPGSGTPQTHPKYAEPESTGVAGYSAGNSRNSHWNTTRIDTPWHLAPNRETIILHDQPRCGSAPFGGNGRGDKIEHASELSSS